MNRSRLLVTLLAIALGQARMAARADTLYVNQFSGAITTYDWGFAKSG
jgi:hypothetical protein